MPTRMHWSWRVYLKVLLMMDAMSSSEKPECMTILGMHTDSPRSCHCASFGIMDHSRKDLA